MPQPTPVPIGLPLPERFGLQAHDLMHQRPRRVGVVVGLDDRRPWQVPIPPRLRLWKKPRLSLLFTVGKELVEIIPRGARLRLRLRLRLRVIIAAQIISGHADALAKFEPATGVLRAAINPTHFSNIYG